MRAAGSRVRRSRISCRSLARSPRSDQRQRLLTREAPKEKSGRPFLPGRPIKERDDEQNHRDPCVGLILAAAARPAFARVRHHRQVDWAPAVARACRRGDPLRSAFAAAAQVSFWHDSDVPRCPRDVRYRGQSGHSTAVHTTDGRSGHRAWHWSERPGRAVVVGSVPCELYTGGSTPS